MPRRSTRIPRIIQELERYFEDCVTQTPLALRFTAVRVAIYLGISTGTASAWLQEYRDAHLRTFTVWVTDEQGQRVQKVLAPKYVISCTNRGPRSEWFIQSWDQITPTQARWTNELTMMYTLLTTLDEEIKPMLKNIRVEFLPMAQHDRPAALRHTQGYLHKLDAYRHMLRDVQADLANVTPVRLRAIVTGLNGMVTAKLNEIQSVYNMVLAI